MFSTDNRSEESLRYKFSVCRGFPKRKTIPRSPPEHHSPGASPSNPRRLNPDGTTHSPLERYSPAESQPDGYASESHFP